MTREQASLAESMEFYVEWFKIHPTRDVMELARVAEWERQGERDTRSPADSRTRSDRRFARRARRKESGASSGRSRAH